MSRKHTDPEIHAFCVDLGKKLRELREDRRLTIIQVGDKLGYSKAQISHIELARAYPTIPMLIQLSRLYNVELEYFFKKEEETMQYSGHDFIGVDWTELPVALGIEVKQRTLDMPLQEYWDYEQQVAEETIALFIASMEDSKLHPHHKLLITDFITALAESDRAGEEAEIYKAILKLKSDVTLVQWLQRNLRSMWT